MKPDWDRLMTDFEGNDSILVGDVDCTGLGKSLCEEHGVKGFPTIKHGHPSDLEPYTGERTYDALSEFAKGLKPMCSPFNIDLCDDVMQAEIRRLWKLDAAELDTLIAEKETLVTKAEGDFKSETKKLQAAYQQLQTDRDAAVKAVTSSSHALLKKVRAHRQSVAATEEQPAPTEEEPPAAAQDEL
jgi:hypothetical protein